MAKEKETTDAAPEENVLANTAFASAGDRLQTERGETLPEDQIAPKVASPTGPVPLSAVISDPKRAGPVREALKERIRKQRLHPRAGELLTEEQVERMSSAERRTVAGQRGYKFPGRRVGTAQFMAFQQKDENLDEPEKERKRPTRRR